MQEYFDVVDDEGNVIGKETRKKCHNGSKLLHPVVHIHVINSSNKLLLQKRALNKDIQPGKWDTSIGGHIQAYELTTQAVIRESMEEAGIKIELSKLKNIGTYIFESEIEKEFVYSHIYFYDGPVEMQESEIDDLQFFTVGEIEKLIEQNCTTPNFIKEFGILKDIYFTSK